MSAEDQRHRLVCAAYVMLLDNGKVLLGRRAPHLWSGGNWMFPAGHLEANETIVDAARREAREEVGIEIAEADLGLGHVMHHVENYERMSFFFVAHAWTGTPTNMEPDKCDALQWFPIDDLPVNLPELCRIALRHAEEGINLSTRNIPKH